MEVETAIGPIRVSCVSGIAYDLPCPHDVVCTDDSAAEVEVGGVPVAHSSLVPNFYVDAPVQNAATATCRAVSRVVARLDDDASGGGDDDGVRRHAEVHLIAVMITVAVTLRDRKAPPCLEGKP